MDPRMMEAMSLHDSPDQFLEDDPNAPIQLMDQSGQAMEATPEMLAAEGMAYAARHMAPNGPTTPSHNLFGAKTMTKAQLQEQKMNEEAGYPSNLDEATKVKELEGKVANIENGIGAILSHLQNGQSSPVNVPQPAVTGGNPAPRVESPTPMPEAFVTATPQSPPSIASNGSSEPDSTQQTQRQVILSDGRKINVPQTSSRAMGLGPATDVAPAGQEQLDDGDDEWGDDEVVQQLEAPEEPKADPKIEKTQRLVQEVVTFMQANDVHRFWRRHLAQKQHRHLGYSGWSKALQAEFDKRFAGFLNDPTFVTSICRKVIDMEMGQALGVKWVCSFLVCTAGFTAFALCGLDS